MKSYLIKKSLHPELTVAELTSKLPAGFDLTNFNQDYFQLTTTFELSQNWLNNLGSISEINEIITEIQAEELISTNTLEHFQSPVGEFAVNYIPEHCVNRNVKKTILGNVKNHLKEQLNKKSRFLNKNFLNVKIAYLLKEGFIKNKISVWQIIKSPNRNLILTKLIGIQNIASYSFRDYEKPLRDNFRGMFPPKLAQIMINIATANQGNDTNKEVIFDPFCGIGTVNMEALLMNYDTIGSDIDPYAIGDSKQNLDWLQKEYQTFTEYKLVQHDATQIETAKIDFDSVTKVVTEGYLGKPRTKAPNHEEALASVKEVTQIYEGFLKSLKKAIKKPLTICFTIPVYRLNNGELVFCKNIVENLKTLGYIRLALIEESLASKLSCSLTPQGNLLYMRKDQFVGREIVKAQIIG